FDDDAPLGEARDRAEGVEACLEFDRHADAGLRVVLGLLSFSCSGRGAACTSTILDRSVVGHSGMRWRGTAEMRKLRCASDVCALRRLNASENIMHVICAKAGPIVRAAAKNGGLPRRLCHGGRHAVAPCD